jgi:hypothetical protein
MNPCCGSTSVYRVMLGPGHGEEMEASAVTTLKPAPPPIDAIKAPFAK